jgi:hypothetical protein
VIGQIGFDPLADAVAAAFDTPQREQLPDRDLHRVTRVSPAPCLLQELMRTQGASHSTRDIPGLRRRPGCYPVE